MRTEHLRPLLDNVGNCNKPCEAVQSFAQGNIPKDILAALQLKKITALQKPNGGVRDIVVGDVIRRLVPSSRPPRSHSRATSAASLVGAFDLISRQATMCAVQRMPEGDTLLSSTDTLPHKKTRTVWFTQGEGGFVHLGSTPSP